MHSCHNFNAPHLHNSKKCTRSIFWFVTFIFILIMSSAVAAKVLLLCIGDSITERNPSGGEGYVKQLTKMLGSEFEVKNFGLSGRTMCKNGNSPYWKEEKFKEVFNLKPDVITLMLGTNDAKPGNWKKACETFKVDAQAMVDTLLSISDHKPQLFLALPPHAYSNRYNISGEVIENEEVPALCEVAMNAHVEIIDAFTPTNSSDYFADGVHPNKKGHDLLAKIFHEKLTSTASISPIIQHVSTSQSSRPVVKIGIANPTGINSRISGYHIFVTDNAKNGASSSRIFLPSGKQVVKTGR